MPLSTSSLFGGIRCGEVVATPGRAGWTGIFSERNRTPRSRGDDMVDPSDIHTRAEFRAALGALQRRSGLSYQRLAERSGVAHNTIHDWVSGAGFPRWQNLEPVLRTWDVPDVSRWQQAHARARADSEVRPGAALAEVTDPFDAEVHRPITVESARGLPVLPPYVRRAHDDRLAEIVEHAAGGASAMALLLDGSSAGKTRALWEALAPLRNQDRWRWWHPRHPTRRDDLRDGLSRIQPRTVLWLNETQRYFQGLSAEEQERIANALRDVLADPRRAPVLVLGTLWHEHYDSLCRDPGSAIRKLLNEQVVVVVPPTFSGPDLDAVARIVNGGTRDPRLAQAYERAAGGQITQYLAGGPELIDRYRHQVSDLARVVIEVAMDAVRRGHRNPLSHDLLHDAAAAQINDDVWDGLAENWFPLALAEAGWPCKGARGPITPIRDRPSPVSRGGRAEQLTDHREPGPSAALYRLADYLEQFGRRERAKVVPPEGFWDAVTHAQPDDQHGLAGAAWSRGLYRNAIQLWTNAAAHGHDRAATELLLHVHEIFPDDPRAAAWVTRRAALENAPALAALLWVLRQISAHDQIQALLARDPAAHVTVDDPAAITELLRVLQHIGEGGRVQTSAQIHALAKRAAVGAALDDPAAVAELLRRMREVAAHKEIQVLLARDPAAHVSLDDPTAVAWMLGTLRQIGANDQLRSLAARAATDLPLDSPAEVAALLQVLRSLGADEALQALAARAASRAPLENTAGGVALLHTLREVQADHQFQVLAARVATQAGLDDPEAVAELQRILQQHSANHFIELSERLPAAGLFALFSTAHDHAERFRFGREQHGTPTERWAWRDPN